jgi:hypothetical protein
MLTEPKRGYSNIFFQSFVDLWSPKISKIETTPLDKEQLDYILDLFVSNVNLLKNNNHIPEDPKEYLVMYELGNKLCVACAISYSNWKSIHPGVLNIFAGKMKMPDLNIGVNLLSHK